MKRKITERMVEGLKLPSKGNVVIFDIREPAGFAVRITAGGARSFTLDYRNSSGVSRRFTIGRWPEWGVEDARTEAFDLRREIAEGSDPVENRKEGREMLAAAPTVKDLGDKYYSEYVLTVNREDQWRNVRDILNKIVYPRWESKKAEALTTNDVRKLHLSLKPTKYRANRVLSTISKMYNWGVEKGLVESNPAKGVEKFVEDQRAAWLDVDQMERLDGAISEYGAESAEMIRLLLLTGFRQREWMRAKKEDFDMRHAIWRKPSHSVKENKTEQVPLSKATMIVLERVIEAAKGSEYLFPGKNPAKCRTTIRRPWEQVLRAAGLAEEYEVEGKRGNKLKKYRPKVRLHDLRHTYISWLADQGVPLTKIGKLVGHQRTETTDRYAHVADKALREAADKFGDMLTRRVQ